MSNLQLVFEEYKLTSSIGDKYFDYMYRTIQFSIVFYGAIIGIGVAEGTELLLKQMIFRLALPVFSIVFGLMYCYNSCALAKIGYFSVKQEMKLKILCLQENNESDIMGWVTYGKTVRGGYLLSYGTILVMYLTLPIFSILWGWQYGRISITDFEWINKVVNIMPYAFYLVYLAFMLSIIKNIYNIDRSMKDLRIDSCINGMHFKSKVKWMHKY